jgi:hypothetical protein
VSEQYLGKVIGRISADVGLTIDDRSAQTPYQELLESINQRLIFYYMPAEIICLFL